MAFENIEATYIGGQLSLNIARITNNMRDNANTYKSSIAGGASAASVATIMVQDANAFLARIQTVVDLATRNNTKYQAALTSLGWPSAEVNSLRTICVDSCNHTKAASLTNATQVNAEADLILATIPIFERIF